MVTENAKPGAIVLMHSGVPNTVAALPQIVEALRLKGYRFVRLNELICRVRSAKKSVQGEKRPRKVKFLAAG